MMTASDALFKSTIQSLPLVHRGKVRDIYFVNDEYLLIVQTDRLSAFDVVLPTPVPGKGKILTALSAFWFKKLAHILPNHLTLIDPESVVAENERHQVHDRAFVIRRLKPLPIEAIVRGYVVGSGWKDYQQTGAICGIPIHPGLNLAEKLPDENITFEVVEEKLGDILAALVRKKAIQLYSEAADYAMQRGIIIADTKFEFGLDNAGQLYLIDEVLTPDSSRFWPADQYRTGQNPPSFDKQFVRDWLEQQDWNKKAPAPELPEEVLKQTMEKYQEALRLLTSD